MKVFYVCWGVLLVQRYGKKGNFKPYLLNELAEG